MGQLPIMERGKPVACHTDWPLFYMNDFARLGLVVPRLAEALDALRAGGCRLQENERGSSIEVDGLAQVQDVFAVLQAGRIDYEVADLVSCAYQG